MENKKTGKVWLVGAGPSDPGLMTLKGRRVLAEAEVVVYDALVGASILAMIPETAEAIHVGKRSSCHTMRQEQISELLAQKALEGKRVVRLKGGDPFLFGRGGEELEVLVRENIPYEVVPGITSAIAVPAYQGIPVTHRDYCSSVHIITGHRREGEAYNLDFEALVRTRGTLVFLMGVAALPEICSGLCRAGMSPDIPAALLSQGTTAGQKRIVATVGTLAREVEARGAMTPAIIVVGEVCALADKFAWMERLPLGGTRIVVTRPRELAGTVSARLRSLGAEVLELPAIRTVCRTESAALQEAAARLETYDWLVFTSPTGVRLFFEELSRQRIDRRKLGGIRIAVIGKGSAKELEKYGFYADLMPEVYDGAHLGKMLAANCRAGMRILIPRAAIGNPELTEALGSVAGLEVEDLALYDTQYGITDGPVNWKEELQARPADYALFTSASTVRGFVSAMEGIDLCGMRAVCIGRQTEAAAAAFGMQTWTADAATIDSLIEKLLQAHEACGNAAYVSLEKRLDDGLEN